MTVEPGGGRRPDAPELPPRQEMNYVLEGRLLIGLNDKEIVLNTGDSLYLDSGTAARDESPRRQNGADLWP